MCLFVCGHSNVQMLTSPPILKLWDTQGYLWLSYDLTEVIKLIGVTFRQKKNIFLAPIFLQLALLPLLGPKEAIGTLGYPIASKLGD